MHVCDICANPLDRVDNQENNVTNERIAILNIGSVAVHLWAASPQSCRQVLCQDDISSNAVVPATAYCHSSYRGS